MEFGQRVDRVEIDCGNTAGWIVSVYGRDGQGPCGLLDCVGCPDAASVVAAVQRALGVDPHARAGEEG